MNAPYIEIDRNALEQVKDVYEATKGFIQEDHNINFNSPVQIKCLFRDKLGITLKTTQIKEIESYLNKFPENTDEHEIVWATYYYLKAHYSLKNYINWMLKNVADSRVYLTKDCWGVVLPNKRPLPKSPEILSCIKGAGNGIELEYGDFGEVTGFNTKGVN